MGSVALGLGEVGSALQQAKALKLKEQMDAAKLAVEQGRLGAEQGQLGVSQQYAGLAAQRQALAAQEFAERQRVAKLPKFVGFRTVGGKLYYGVQDPTTGQVSTKEVTGVDSAADAQAIEESIQKLPPEAQASARATVVPYLQAQDYPGARGALKPIMQKYTESQLPGQTTTSTTTQNLVLDTPQGPKVVSVPKTTTTHKGPAGKGAAPSQPRAVTDITKDLGLPAGSHVLGSKPPTRSEISKLIDPVGDADRRYKVMLDAAAHPNAQNDVAMLFNHMGMTLSAQRGARITNAEILRAIDARSVPEDLLAMWTKVQNGQFLTPDQRQNMLNLGQKNREFIWQQAWEKGKSESMANKLPRTLPGLPPVPGVHYIGEDVTLKAGGKARVVEVHPDGSYEVKPY